jgi:cobalt/nickel transport protein
MKALGRAFLVFATLPLVAPSSQAHYNMLLPQAASVKKGEATNLVYQWGHPFEHQLFDAPAPEFVFVFGPDGKKREISKLLDGISVPGPKQATAYRLPFTPEERGDYLFVLKTPPIWMAEDQEFLEDTVKVVLHVQVQKGWDATADLPLEIVPLTRPYGLRPGMVFQAQIQNRNGRLTRPVEIEHYHASPPASLPAEEHITRTAKTDLNGVVTCTLTDAGWWCLTAQCDGHSRDHDGKQYPVRQRSTFWVFVDEATAAK